MPISSSNMNIIVALLLVFVLVYVWRSYESFIPKWGARTLYGAIPPACVSCNMVLPSQRGQRCPSDPSRCLYPGLTSTGHLAALASIKDTFVKSIESFFPDSAGCGSVCAEMQEGFIDQDNSSPLLRKNALLTAAMYGA